MSDERVLLQRDGDVATLTINREQALNALDRETLEALSDVLTRLAGDLPLAAVITGAGKRAFVAGADIAAMREMSVQEATDFARLGQGVFAAIEQLACPVIAAVNGFALGGGTELALACDFIYASDRARFGQPEVKLGIIPGFGGTQRLSRRVGPGMARELIYSGRMIDAAEALRIGLANRVVPAAELLDAVASTAREIAAVGPGAVAASKRVILAGADLSLAEAIELEARAFGECFAWNDQREGMAAFLDKREPKFTRS
ncbi:MAG: enoyl-CoA hydratase-related protein [Myxococcales bacterium]|nr:enoyl-CoA hydratase-related protein [Myxococcales bacterium]